MYFFKTDSLEDLRDGQSETCKRKLPSTRERNEFTRYEEKRAESADIERYLKEKGKPVEEWHSSFFHRIFSIRKMLNFRYKILIRWKILAKHRRGNAWSIFFRFCSSFTPSPQVRNTANILLNIMCLSRVFFQRFSHNFVLFLLHFFSISITISQFDFISSFWNNYNKILLIFLFSLMFIRYLRILKNLAIFLNFTFRLLNF